MYEPQASRQFAVEVVERLRSAGHEAYWAGGCVRDQLLGIEPKDYDVATDAPPDRVRDLFGHRRSLAVGAAFGVITLLGKRNAAPIEVATFRRDVGYSDGRHPDRVAFSTAEEDAQRRDFTINGLFFDPLAQRVIDFVGGQEDLRLGVVRAIRDPAERFDEDKLRMLRAIRFAATFGFQIEPLTMSALQRLAGEIVIVSAERIAAEMRRMLTHSNRRRAVELLRESNLLTVILPEAAEFLADEAEVGNDARHRWLATLAVLDSLDQPTFATALAALVQQLKPEVTRITDRWKLSNDEAYTTRFLLEHEPEIRRARELPWPRLQRLLIANPIGELLCLTASLEKVLDTSTANTDHCRERLRLPPHELNPPPLITGDDLKAAGLAAGKLFKMLLEKVRDAQLEKRISTRDEALALALQLSVIVK